MNRKLARYLAPALALMFAASAAPRLCAQTAPARFSFRSGQAMYIVAFRHTQLPLTTDPTSVDVTRRDIFDYDLDAERKVRKEIEEWRFFRVVDKPSDADFVFLVNIDDSSIEGLALPLDAYRQHFKEKFDLDDLRDSAHGRYVAGPLNLPTISRLTERLVRQFREKVSGSTASVK